MPNAPKAEIENTQTSFVSPSKNSDEKKKEKKEKRALESFLCYTNTVNDCKWILLVYQMLACPYNLVIFIIRRGFTTSAARRGNLQKERVT